MICAIRTPLKKMMSLGQGSVFENFLVDRHRSDMHCNSIKRKVIVGPSPSLGKDPSSFNLQMSISWSKE